MWMPNHIICIIALAQTTKFGSCRGAMVVYVAGIPRSGWSCWVFDYHNSHLEGEMKDSRIELWWGAGERPTIVETAIVFITKSGLTETCSVPHGSFTRISAPQEGFALMFDYAGRDEHQRRYQKSTLVAHLSYSHPMREQGFHYKGVDYKGREIFMKFRHQKEFDGGSNQEDASPMAAMAAPSKKMRLHEAEIVD